MKKIRLALIFDGDKPGSDDWKMQEMSVIGSLLACLGLDPDQKDIFSIEFRGNMIPKNVSEFMDKHFDLVVIDYGGATLWTTSGFALYNVGALKDYAEAHPGSLVVLWTDYTADIYRYELEHEELKETDNIVYHYEERHTYDDNYGDLNGSFKFKNKLIAWFSNEVNHV